MVSKVHNLLQVKEPGFLKLAAHCPVYLEKELSYFNALTVEFIQRLLNPGDNRLYL